jgi:hypothetical protein
MIALNNLYFINNRSTQSTYHDMNVNLQMIGLVVTVGTNLAIYILWMDITLSPQTKHLRLSV